MFYQVVKTPPLKNAKILMILNKSSTEEIKLETVIPANREADVNNAGGRNATPVQLSIATALSLAYAKMYAPVSLMEYCDGFILSNINDLIENKPTVPYSLKRFTEAVEFAVLYEGSISSSRIYEYTSTLVTRLKHLSRK